MSEWRNRWNVCPSCHNKFVKITKKRVTLCNYCEKENARKLVSIMSKNGSSNKHR